MTKATIWHNPRCSKSRQTLELLEAQTSDVHIIKYLDTPPSRAELEQALAQLALEPQDIVRKGEAIYKEKFAGKTLDREGWLDALVEYPKLIERPIVLRDGKAIIGRPPENVKRLF